MTSAYPQPFNKVLNEHTLTPDDFRSVIGTVTRLGGSMPGSDELRDLLLHNDKLQTFCAGFMAVINDSTGLDFERHFQPNLPKYNEGVSAAISYRLNNPNEFSYDS